VGVSGNVDRDVAHPEHRPAIGTRAEYDRLMSLFLDSQSVAADR